MELIYKLKGESGYDKGHKLKLDLIIIRDRFMKKQKKAHIIKTILVLLWNGKYTRGSAAGYLQNTGSVFVEFNRRNKQIEQMDPNRLESSKTYCVSHDFFGDLNLIKPS